MSDSVGRLGLGGDDGGWNTGKGSAEAREEGAGGHEDGEGMLVGEDGDSALGMLSCAGIRILYPDLGGDC